jgi:hypothetical protein
MDRWCVEIFLPVDDPDGVPFPPEPYLRLKERLVDAFGGVTAFTRSPAEGRWRDQGAVEHDDIVVFETMTEGLDEAWWRTLRDELAATFRQKEILLRAHQIRML